MEINDDINNIIICFLENNTTEEERDYCLNWVQQSDENYMHFKNMVYTWEVSRMYYPKNNIANLEKIYSNHKLRLFSFYYRITGIVALVIVCILSIAYIYQTNKTEYKTVFSEKNKKEVLLPDNSKVWLNANSSIKYPSKFNKKRRTVSLIGEAFFDVTENSDSPFIVSTSKIEIKVLGTRFLVMESTSSDEITTILESGKISLKIESFQNIFILEPNDKITYNKNTNEIKREKIIAKDYIKWINNSLIIENIPLENVLKQLEERYNVDIVIEKESIKKVPVSFILDDESLEEILNTLQLIESFKYEKKQNKIIIK